ncbi:hypothetical protein ARMGADRAFT_1082406 [Armillaria gallica]|uniref:Uncharacterized protein n=1 Tax=Armillaria gallica TaxID=47427 RepID=A0A2H3DA54_ARMGA|nr:hypothetical protein ARMGADRAFT_1082406 [Armillaria gallica]
MPFLLTQVAKDHAENGKRKSSDTIDLSSSGTPIDGQEPAEMQPIDDSSHCPGRSAVARGTPLVP